MSKFSFIHAIVVIANLSMSYAQQWSPVGSGFDDRVLRLKPNSDSSLLYSFGLFENCGQVPVEYWAQFNGQTWDSVPGIGKFGADLGISGSIIEFNGLTYFGGLSLYSWDGNVVDTIFSCTMGTSIGEIRGILVYNNELIVYGCFYEIRGDFGIVYSNHIVAWDGQIWKPIGNNVLYNYFGLGIFGAIVFNNALFIGGSANYYSPHILKLDSGIWNTPGVGINSPGTSVGRFEIYNGKLYAIGGFSRSQGAPGNCIASWDGFTWDDVNGGVGIPAGVSPPFGLSSLLSYNGELYVCGKFDSIGGTSAKNIAKWDGSKWCSLGNTFDDGYYGISDLAVYNQELYAGGAFYTIDGDSMNFIAKWLNNTSLDTCGAPVNRFSEYNSLEIFTLYPNPTSNHFQIDLELQSPSAIEITILSPAGQQVLNHNVTQAQTLHRHKIDVSALAAGLYWVKVTAGERVLVKKLVVEK